MNRSRWRSRSAALGALGAAGALAWDTPQAFALPPIVLTLADGYGGDLGENGGPGNEQPTVVAVKDASGDVHVVVLYMSSDVDAAKDLDPWQCKCSSVRLSATASPEIVADRVYLTQNTGTDRPCNHPIAATDGTRIVWAHGHNTDGGITQTYVQAIDAKCKPLGDTHLVSDPASNAQQGAPDLRFLSGSSFVVGYYHDGNDDDHTYVRGLTLSNDGALAASYRVAAVDDTSIGRPTIAVHGEKALICAARGDNRPPEDGVACAWINAATGAVYWRDKVVAPSDEDNHVYMNQPSLASLGNGRFALLVHESTGQGKTADVKGATRTHLHVLEPSDTDGPGAAGIKGAVHGVGTYQTHSALVVGGYDRSGETHVGLYEASITGSGVPVLSLLRYDVAAQIWAPFDQGTGRWVVGPYEADSGKLANLHGANPGKQGREFMRGIGDVPNPGAGVDGGWMSEVETFFALPYTGRKPPVAAKPGEGKNALFLSLVPGKTSTLPSPEPPPCCPVPVPGGGGAAGPSPGDVAGCQCGAPGGPGRPGGLASACAALLLLSRRRRSAHGHRR